VGTADVGANSRCLFWDGVPISDRPVHPYLPIGLERNQLLPMCSPSEEPEAYIDEFESPLALVSCSLLQAG
jgi:hypothetical protein